VVSPVLREIATLTTSTVWTVVRISLSVLVQHTLAAILVHP